jgi:hypothetical protein
MAATQVPKMRLEAENRNPTANAGLSFMNEERFLIIVNRVMQARGFSFGEKNCPQMTIAMR